MTAERYYNGQPLETWVIPVDFDYYQWEILDVETNRTTLWGEDEGSSGR